MKNFAARWWRQALVALLLIAVGAYFLIGRDGGSGATLRIVPGDFKEQVSISGTVIAARDVDLGFAANGRISGVYAAVGQHVAAGAFLAQIENGDLVAALAQKQAALAEAEANLASLQAGTRPEEIAVAAAAVASAEAALIESLQSAYTVSDDAIHNKADAFFTNPRTDPQLTFNPSNANLEAAVELDRVALEPMFAKWKVLVSELAAANAVDSAERSKAYLTQVAALLASMNDAANQSITSQTVTNLATARTNVDSAIAALSAAVTALNSAQKNLILKQASSTLESIAVRQASVAAARADVENAQAALVKTRVAAPFGGVVTRMEAKVGEIVSPSASLISMQGDGIFQIETFIPEVAIARVAVGNPAAVTLDAYGDSIAFSAAVVAVDPAETVKDGVPTYKTTLAFSGADPRIRSGMTANVVVETGVLPDAIVIPAGAVGTKDDRAYVSVLVEGAIVSRPVTLGSSPSLGQVEILSGLSEGDVIELSPEP